MERCFTARVGYLLHLHIICINKLSAKQRNCRAALRSTARSVNAALHWHVAVENPAQE